MNRKWIVAALLSSALSAPAFAQDAAPVDAQADSIVVTAARTTLPPSALPLTIDVLRVSSGGVSEITTFHADQFPRLGLPDRLPAYGAE